jgi:tellurite resistance protein TerB
MAMREAKLQSRQAHQLSAGSAHGPAHGPAQHKLMEAMVASCALVANADCTVHPSERRRLMHMMRAMPTFAAFSRVEAARLFDAYEEHFLTDPNGARARAVAALSALGPQSGDVNMLLFACQQVLEADGVADPKEYEALGEVGRSLGVK